MSHADPTWFESWFDSPYYPVLYSHRDPQEASLFLSALLSRLKVAPGASILDLACGSGRHSVYLAGQGYSVTGVDLSESSIQRAKRHRIENLSFIRADMRTFGLNKEFDLILNLFTSFGYFDRQEENLQVLQRIASHLKPEGLFVLDFMNTYWVSRTLVASEIIERQAIRFEIARSIEDRHVVKRIQVMDGTKSIQYLERVQMLTPENLAAMLTEAGLKVVRIFGNYQLDTFDPDLSQRIILVAANAS
ncbi:MAG: class I SAM-dependent methyltransferase [Flavobacteriales bacterium]|jgi:2-polyprenyl-3-methyl-5-hydroxy-6-metoxy-1,4-benzoquinol methylase